MSDNNTASQGEEQKVVSPAKLFPHREVSIGLLKVSSGFCVRTPRGQKDPGHIGWDPATNNKGRSEQNILALERIDDNLGIHLFGSVVDVDVDTDNPILMQALDAFLPYTAHVWGRPSRLRTHRLFELTGLPNNQFDPSEFRFLSYLTKNEAIKLEVRGGRLQSGQYSLMPGSLHPSGEPYEWDSLRVAASSPVYVPVDALMGAIRKACAATILAPFFTEGSRNRLCMALSGFLHRVVMHIEDTPNPTFFFDKYDAEDFINKLLDLVDDDEADRPSRMKTFEQTWAKADAGEKMAGLTLFAKEVGDENLIPALYTLLVDSRELQELDDFIERYWVRMNTNDVCDVEKMGRRGVVAVMHQSAFRNSNLHRKVTIGNERRNLVDMLLHSRRANRFDGFAFAPDKDKYFERGEQTYVNQWQGFAIEPWAEKVEASEVQPFIEYVRNILANDSNEAFDWIVSWIADILKFPQEKCGTALVLVGLPGSGKSFLGGNILRPIIGIDHSMQVNHITQITQQFNVDSSGKLLIQCDEAINSRRHEDANKLKSLITDPTKRVEPKGVDAYEVENLARFLFTSNNVSDAVAITDGTADRRYAVFETNNAYAAESPLPREEKDQFWRTMHTWVAEPENLSKLHRYLIDLEYDRDLIRRPLDTEARRRIQQHSVRGFDDWLISVAAGDHPFYVFGANDPRARMGYCLKNNKYIEATEQWPEVVVYGAVKDAYEIYRARKGMKATTPDFNESQIVQEFQKRKLLPMEYKQTKVSVVVGMSPTGDEVKRRVNCRQFPSKSQIVSFVAKFGFTAEAEAEEEGQITQPVSSGPDY